jgi:hypothetical protein
MPTSPGELPAALDDSFSYSLARQAGVSARRLRARDLDAPFYGVRRRRADAPPGRADDAPLARDRAMRARVIRDARSYAAVMSPGAFFAGRTAAVLLGLPAPHGAELEVGVFAPRRAPRGRGIRGRALNAAYVDVQVRDDLRVASPASAWTMLGSEISERDLVRLGDAIVRVPRDDRGVPRPEWRLATLDELRAAVDIGRRPGTARLRRALARVRVGSMSPLETDVRLNAEDAGLPEPELDVEIRSVGGRLRGIADMRYPRFRVLIEVEGDHHRTDRRQWARDIEKQAAYAAEGYETVRLTGIQVRQHPERGVTLVRDALLRGGWVPGSR